MRLVPRTPTRKRLDELDAEFRAATSTLANPSSLLMDAFSSAPSSAGQRVTTDKALGLAGVWSAVTLISEALGMLPLKVYRTDDNGDPLEANQHRTWRMLHDKPNEVTPAHRFWATVAVQLLLWGNAFLVKERDEFDGLVNQLWLEPPDGMQVYIGNDRQKVFKKETTQGPKTWTSDRMVHIVGPSTNGLLGLSPISVCKQAFGIALAREEFEGTFYSRGATMSGLVQHPNLIGPEATKNLRESLQAIYGGSKNAHQIGVLEEGATWQNVSMPLTDLEFVASKQLSATEIATMFRIPPAYLGGSTGDSLTYATVESNKTHFATFSVAPWANAIASTLSQDASIFPQQNTFYAEFVQEGLLRADTQSRANYYKEALDPAHGWMTREEVRKRENLSARDDDPTEPPPPPVEQNGSAPVPPELAAQLADQ